MTPAALFKHMARQVFLIEPMRYDNNSARLGIVQPRHDQGIEPAIYSFDLIQVVGIINIERIVENDHIATTARQ